MDGKIAVHVTVNWDARLSGAQYTKAEAWALLRKFHVTLEKKGEDHPDNPRFYFVWPAPDGAVRWDEEKSSDGTKEQKTEAKQIADGFAEELRGMGIFLV